MSDPALPEDIEVAIAGRLTKALPVIAAAMADAITHGLRTIGAGGIAMSQVGEVRAPVLESGEIYKLVLTIDQTPKYQVALVRDGRDFTVRSSWLVKR